jgi:hypothetical protein
MKYPTHCKAGSILVTAVVLVLGAGCGPPSSVPSVGGGNGGGTTQSGSWVYSGMVIAYLLQLSWPSGGGDVTGSQVIAVACQTSSGGQGVDETKPEAVTGTYDGHGNVSLSTQGTAIGGTKQPTPGELDSQSGDLIIGDGEDWTPATHLT